MADNDGLLTGLVRTVNNKLAELDLAALRVANHAETKLGESLMKAAHGDVDGATWRLGEKLAANGLYHELTDKKGLLFSSVSVEGGEAVHSAPKPPAKGATPSVPKTPKNPNLREV